MITEDDRYKYAIQIISILQNAGFKAYLVGGCVRDMIMQNTPKDYDIVTDAKPKQVLKLFKRTIKVGIKFGVVKVMLANYNYDVATFRKDMEYNDGRHPNRVEFTDEKEDVLRRDITINGLLYDPIEDKITDYTGGIKDIENMLIQTIGEPHQRFSEDYLRLIRTVRFASRYNFKIDEKTYDAILILSDKIVNISKERIGEELTRIFDNENRAEGMQYLLDTKLLKYIFPNIYNKYNNDKTSLLIKVLKDLSKTTDAEITYAILNIIPDFDQLYGKVPDKSNLSKVEKICKGLRFSNARTNKIVELYRVSFCLWLIGKFQEWEVKRLFRSPFINEVIKINLIIKDKMDIKDDSISICIKLLDEYKNEIYVIPLINGKDLIDMGIEKGKIFSEILFDIENQQLEKRIHTREKALEYIRKKYLG